MMLDGLVDLNLFNEWIPSAQTNCVFCVISSPPLKKTLEPSFTPSVDWTWNDSSLTRDVFEENTVPDTNNLDRTDTDVADETVYDDDYYEDVARPPIRKVAAPSAPPAPSAPSAPSAPPAPSTPSTPTTTTVRTTTSTTKPPVRSTTVPSTTGRPRISTPRTTTPPRRSPVRGPSANGPAGARPKDTPQRKSDESVTDSAGPVYLSPQDNEIADSANVRNNVPPNVNEPTNTENAAGSEGTFGGRLNLGQSLDPFVNSKLCNSKLNFCSQVASSHWASSEVSSSWRPSSPPSWSWSAGKWPNESFSVAVDTQIEFCVLRTARNVTVVNASVTHATESL